MTFGNTIAYYRKNLGITQEALAQQLEVTNQAVSKWESDQCCPDIQLLPKLADIFGVSIDALFGREIQPETPPEPEILVDGLPWKDDGVLRAVLYIGHTLKGHKTFFRKAEPAAREIQFVYDGPALNVRSDFSVTCGVVAGNVSAGTSVSCGTVAGSVDAGCDVNCGTVGGDVDAGSDVTCTDVEGSVDAGSHVECGNVGGNVDAGSGVTCTDVEGSVDAGGNVNCGNVGGDVDAGGSVSCASVGGDVDAGGSVTIRK